MQWTWRTSRGRCSSSAFRALTISLGSVLMTLASAEVQNKLQSSVCLRLPMDASVDQQGKKQVLLQHTAFYVMLNRPGVAVVDFAHDDVDLHGTVVSTFPLAGNLFYGPAEMNVILDLPPGSLTQRTLIYAVRTHPELAGQRLRRAEWPPFSRGRKPLAVPSSNLRAGPSRLGSRFPGAASPGWWAARRGKVLRGKVGRAEFGRIGLWSARRCWRLSPGHWTARCEPQRLASGATT